MKDRLINTGVHLDINFSATNLDREIEYLSLYELASLHS